jgi:para-aminobenzoate synthetase component 1
MSTYIHSVVLHSTPYEVAAIFRDRNYFAFLDSSRNGSVQGRYSILGWDPEIVFRAKRDRIDLCARGEWIRRSEDPISALDRLLRIWTPESANTIRFAGGAIGYLGYDLFRFLERYDNLRAVDDLHLPDCCLAIYDMLLVFDHENNEWTLRGNSSETRLEMRLSEIQRHFADLPANRGVRKVGPPQSNMDKQQYVAAVEKALDYIAAGDIYQVNLSQRFCQQVEASPFELFSSLRSVSPSFYGAYLNCGDHVVISSSPELFLAREGPVIETRPIKGTRPRGRDKEEDQQMKTDLIDNEKEAAELAMIVDLERNDLGRLCEYGSVEVVEHRYVDRLPTLFHTVSTVRGRLRGGTTIVDILRATFPGGSISGCPKIRAIQIIDELERTQRHVYTGSIGFMGFNGDLRLNVAIRTMTVIGNRVYYHVGSGIVADSIPEREYEETLHKAAALQRAIADAG